MLSNLALTLGYLNPALKNLAQLTSFLENDTLLFDFYTLSQTKQSDTYIHCLQVAIMTPEGGWWGYPYIKISPYRKPTQHRKGWPYHQNLRPLLFLNGGVGSFTSHKNQISESAVRWDLWFFVLIFEKTRKSNCFQMSLKRQHFLLSHFKDPECWSDLRLNPQSLAQQTSPLPTELTKWWSAWKTIPFTTTHT